MYLGNFGTTTEQVTTPKANHIYNMDALEFFRQMPDESVQMIVTSPPYYGLRDYGVDGQFGLESTPFEYVSTMVQLFREARRVLKDDGVLFLNLGDTYASHQDCKSIPQTMHKGKNAEIAHVIDKGKSVSRDLKMLKENGFRNKSLMQIPSRVAIALCDDGWILRNEIIWHKPSCMPESMKDRFTRDFEMVYFFSKNERYYFDQDAVREPAKDWGNRDRSNGKYTSGDVPIAGGKHSGLTNGDFSESGRIKRTVWSISPRGFKGAHFATFPTDLVEICVKAGSGAGDVVCDPFMGSGTTALVSKQFNRQYIGSELNINYVLMARQRLNQPIQLDMFSIAV